MSASFESTPVDEPPGLQTHAASATALESFIQCNELTRDAHGAVRLQASVTYRTALGTVTGPAMVALIPRLPEGTIAVETPIQLLDQWLPNCFSACSDVCSFRGDTGELVIRSESAALAGWFVVRILPLGEGVADAVIVGCPFQKTISGS